MSLPIRLQDYMNFITSSLCTHCKEMFNIRFLPILNLKFKKF